MSVRLGVFDSPKPQPMKRKRRSVTPLARCMDRFSVGSSSFFFIPFDLVRDNAAAQGSCNPSSEKKCAARRLVDLLLLVKADLTRTHVDEEEKTADDGEDLEEVVLGEVLVRVVLVEL